ncbi:MAG: HAD-IC family P-type ATPase, partial [Caulobacterales bacterium]|nr:HAD-IC family P-type ATPase [Caulobacterales bacterium]
SEAGAAGARSGSWLQVDGEAPIAITAATRLRPGAQDVIGGLTERGLAVEMLSGDREEAVRDVAASLGVVDWRAAAAPADKCARLEALAEAGARTLMVGDGLNDAPALAKAHVSISPGSALEASQNAADFVVQGDSLAPVLDAVDTARAARRRVLENFAFAAFYNMCAVPLAMAGLVTPLIAAIAMSGSSLVVTLNALRIAGARSGS